MNKKNIFYNMFDEKYNAKKMREQILLKNDCRKKKYMVQHYRYVTVFIGIVVICITVVLMNQKDRANDKSSVKLSENQYNIININKVDNISQSRLKIDGLKKDIKSDMPQNLPVDNTRLVVPTDLKDIDFTALYIKGDNSANYDKLANYEFSYYNSEENRSIVLQFSKEYKPVRDYHFSDISKISKINDLELMIYQYENSFMIEFIYNDYYFDIETHNINIDELERFLQSIIK